MVGDPNLRNRRWRGWRVYLFVPCVRTWECIRKTRHLRHLTPSDLRKYQIRRCERTNLK